MTTPDVSANPFERWPGYTEQSWQERFAELDRRHTELKTRMYREITEHGRITHKVLDHE